MQSLDITKSGIFQAVVEDLPLALVALDTDARVVAWNPGAEKLFGWSSDEVVGRLHPSFSGSGDGDFGTSFAALLQGKTISGAAVVLRKKDDSTVTAGLWASPVRNKHDEVIGAVSLSLNLRDLHDKHGELLYREQQLRAVFENVFAGILIVDDEGRYLDVNPAACRIFGKSREELVGSRLGSLCRDGNVRAAWEQSRERNEVLLQEVAFTRDDGKTVQVEYSGKRHFMPERTMITIRDLTEHRQLEQRLRQAQKMEAVGRLAGGVAHDINNMLTVIRGYSELLLEKLDNSDPLRRYAAGILDAADRSATVARQLLAFSRRQVMQPTVLDLNAVIREMSSLLEKMIGEDIRLRFVLQSDLGLVKADSGQMGQILLNLAANARDAMPNGGNLFIETCNAALDESYCCARVGAVPGDYVLLAVSDTGCGMEPEQMAHIFEPFFTTKDLGKGTGLGLATVYGIVKQSGGYITAYSEPGQGSTFKIYLPRVGANHSSDQAAATSTCSPRTILVIDDDTELRKMVSSYLTKLKYNVLAAAGGDDALTLMENYQGTIDLVLTDLTMPGTSGLDLAAYVALQAPRARWVYMSGYSRESSNAQGLIQPEAAFLSKPFQLRELAQAVEKALRVTGAPGEPSVPNLEQGESD